MSDKSKPAAAGLLGELASMKQDTPRVLAAVTPAPSPSPTAPAQATRPARKPAAVKPAVDLAAAAPITSTVSLYGPAADALRRLQMALMTTAGRNVSASAAVSVALQYAADQLSTDGDQLAELLADVSQNDKRRRHS